MEQRNISRSRIPLATPKHKREQKKETGTTIAAMKKKDVPDFKQLHKAWETKFQKGKAQTKKPTTQAQPFHLNNNDSRSLLTKQKTSNRHYEEQFVADEQSKFAIMNEIHQPVTSKLFGGLSRLSTARLSTASTIGRAMPSRRFTFDANNRSSMATSRQFNTRMQSKHVTPSSTKQQMKRAVTPTRNDTLKTSRSSAKTQRANDWVCSKAFEFKIDPHSLNSIMNGKGIDSTPGRLSTQAGPIRRATFAGRSRTNPLYQPRRVSIFRKEFVPQRRDPFADILEKHLAQQNQLKSKWRRDLNQSSTVSSLLTPRRKYNMRDLIGAGDSVQLPVCTNQSSHSNNHSKNNACNGTVTEDRSKSPIIEEGSVSSAALNSVLRSSNSATKKDSHVTWSDVLGGHCETDQENQSAAKTQYLPKPKAATQLNFGTVNHSVVKTPSLGTVQELTEQFQSLSPSTPDRVSQQTATLSFDNMNYTPISTPLHSNPLMDISDFPLVHCRTKQRTPHNKVWTKPKQSPRQSQRHPLEDKTQSLVNVTPDADPLSLSKLNPKPNIIHAAAIPVTPKGKENPLILCTSTFKADSEVSKCFTLTSSSPRETHHRSAFKPYQMRNTNPIATTFLNGDDRHFYAILNGSHDATLE